MLQSRHPSMVGVQLQGIFEINELPGGQAFAVFSVRGHGNQGGSHELGAGL